jgi:alginate O-acetyltransferase complex protein AlgI
MTLLAGSYLFCLAWDWSFLVTILVFSGLTFLLAIKIEQTEKGKLRWLQAGIAFNVIGVLSFKYFSYPQELLIRLLRHFEITSPDPSSWNLLIPIGISFYILQSISYLVDVYRKQIHANRDFVEVSLYLAYFPKLMAGPIERADLFFKQIHDIKIVDNSLFTNSLLRIFVGLIRKLVISDIIASLIPVHVFTSPKDFSSLDLLFWWTVFAFIVYNDFAGYTSIAIGVSGLFGVQLSKNFEQPFFSTSYIDFWNRWHMSLSNWLRDYIYLPVSRALLRRNPSGRHWPNLMIPPVITMLVSGLWHGLNPHFMLWGLLNGMLQGFERLQKLRPKKNDTSKWAIYARTVITILVLLIVSVPFKLDLNESFEFWESFFIWSLPETLTIRVILLPIAGMGISLLIDFLSLTTKDEDGLLNLSRQWQIILVTIGMFLIFLATRQQTPAPFIYQEF